MWQLDISQQRHILQVSAKSLYLFLQHRLRPGQIAYSVLLVSIIAIFLVKILLITVILRCYTPRRKVAQFIRLFIVFLICYYLASFLVRTFLCTPISGFWNHNGSCVSLDTLLIVDSFVSVITDGVIIALPVILAWSLHVSPRKKLRVVVLLGAGGLVIVTNIYRLVITFVQRGTTDFSDFIIHLIYTG